MMCLSSYLTENITCPNYKDPFFGLSTHIRKNIISVNHYCTHGSPDLIALASITTKV
jgi:hypothetical protein